METASQQDTFDHFMGAGAFQFSWWQRCRIHGVSRDGSVSDSGWSAELTAESDDRTVTFTVDHGKIMQAARRVIANKAGDASQRFISATCRQACRDLVFDVGSADFDACTSDEVLQLIVLGEVVFG